MPVFVPEGKRNVRGELVFASCSMRRPVFGKLVTTGQPRTSSLLKRRFPRRRCISLSKQGGDRRRARNTLRDGLGERGPTAEYRNLLVHLEEDPAGHGSVIDFIEASAFLTSSQTLLFQRTLSNKRLFCGNPRRPLRGAACGNPNSISRSASGVPKL